MYLRRPLLLLAGLAVLAGAEPVPPPSASVKLAPVPLRRPKPVPVRFDAAQPADPAPAAKPAPKKHRPGRAAPKKAAPAERGSLPVAVRLVDGSMLRGTLRAEPLPAKSRALGAVTIDLAKVERLAVGTRHGMLRVHFRNGDRATVRPGVEDFSLDTLLGRVKLPLSKVRSITFNPSTPSTSSTVSTLLYHCTFDSPQSIAHPAAGPAGRFLGGSFVPGKAGRALRTFADEPAAEVDFKPGILGSRGTIEFWAKREQPDASAFRDGNLRFFGLWLHEKGETPQWCSTHFQFTSNDGMGMSGLCGMVNHCSWATNPSFGGNPYGVIRDNLWGWHHYAVAWDAEGLPGTKAPDGGPAVVAVFLDGKAVSTQGRQTVSFGAKHLKSIPGRFAKLAFPTPSNGWGSSGGHVPFLIDEFKIWSVPKTEFTR